MTESENVWGIKEFNGDGISCPITPANLPFYKKVFLFFFRFGVCPACVFMSLTHSLQQLFKQYFITPKKRSR